MLARFAVRRVTVMRVTRRSVGGTCGVRLLYGCTAGRGARGRYHRCAARF